MLEHQEAREFFPRGLSQPDGSFRFSVDALLLAAFAARLAGGAALHLGIDTSVPLSAASLAGGATLLDLGCGCGVVGLGFLLLRPEFNALGLDVQPELIRAAQESAARLGLTDRYLAQELDLRQLIAPAFLKRIADFIARREQVTSSWPQAVLHLPALFTLVTANPPYRKPGSGRLPASAARRLALFGDTDTLTSFVHAASLALAPGGLFCLIFTLDREDELRKVLLEYGFAPAQRLEISGKEGQAPEWLLLSAVRQVEAEAVSTSALEAVPAGEPGAVSTTLTPASELPERLYLRKKQTRGAAGIDELTPEALQFCPFLACNGSPSHG